MPSNYALKLLQDKSKQTNQIFTTKLNNDAFKINKLGNIETLYTFLSAQHLSVPFFFPKRYHVLKNSYFFSDIIIGRNFSHTNLNFW
jgi:hypothetical protein